VKHTGEPGVPGGPGIYRPANTRVSLAKLQPHNVRLLEHQRLACKHM